MKRNKIIWILLGVVVILIAAAAIFGSKKDSGTKVATEVVEKRTITEMVSASGKIYPEFEVKISSDVSGEIVDLMIQEGDSVTKGQLLLRINPETYQASLERLIANSSSSKAQIANSRSQVAQLEANLAQVKAQLQNAQNAHNRNVQLKKDGIISTADFETTETQVRTAEANVKSAEANIQAAKESVKAAEFNTASAEASVKEARENLARTSIYAPASGIVSLLNVEKGERVVGTLQMTGTEILRIANMNTMEVQVDVSENDVLRVAIGDEANIEVDAYLGEIFKGKVTEIANSAQSVMSATSTDQVTNFTVTVRIDPSSYRDIKNKVRFPFRPGMSASVDIKTDTKEKILTLPIQAVTTREDEANKNNDDKIEVVFVYCEGDTVKMVQVKTGIQDDKYIEIVSGLKGKEEIVVEPYDAITRKLEQGEKVIKTDKDELFGRKKED
jgi:HlyD family secretion protein